MTENPMAAIRRGRAEVTSSQLGRVPTGDNGSCYLGQRRRGNYGWHLNCHHYAPEPTLPIYTLLSSFALGRCRDITGRGDRVGCDGMHDERDAEMNGHTRSGYFSLFTISERSRNPHPPGLRGGFMTEKKTKFV